MAKAQYIGVGGVARKVKQPYVGVSGVARKVKSGYVGVSGVARQFFQGGVPASSLAVGSSVYLKENGTNVEYLVVHQGNPSTSLYDASCNGTWLLRKDVYEKRQYSTSGSNNYPESTTNSYLNSTFLSILDTSVQSAVKQVKLPYTKSTTADYVTSSVVLSGANGFSAKVFLLAAYEVGITYVNYYNVSEDGAKLDFFSTGDTTSSNNKRIAYLEGSAVAWFLRTPGPNSSSAILQVWTDGGPASQNYSTTTFGIRPALILPSTALFNPDTLEFVSA